MRVTISREDNTVIVNGTPLSVDCSDLSHIIRVVQWDGAIGWIEFVQAFDGGFIPNIKIIDFKPYDYLVDRWRLALAERAANDKENKVRSIEEEINRIETNKKQAEEIRAMTVVARDQAEQQRAEKQAIVDQIAKLNARSVEQDARIKELKAQLEAQRLNVERNET